MGSSCVVTVGGVDHLVLRGGSLSVGSADAADIQVDDQRVQGVHARIEDVDGDFLYVDDSTDGSFLGDTGRAIRGGSYLLPGGTTVVRLADQDDGPELIIGVSSGIAGSGAAPLSGAAPSLPPIPISSIPTPAPLPPQDPIAPLPSQEPAPSSPPPPPPEVVPQFAPPGGELPSGRPIPVGGGLPSGPDASSGWATPTSTPPPPPPPPSPSPTASAAWDTTGTAVSPAPAPPPPPPPPGTSWVAAAPGPPVSGAPISPSPARPSWSQPAVFVVLVVLGLVAAGVVFAVVQTSGTTSAQDISAGRCYEQPSGEFTGLKEQDCVGAHDLEIIMIITMPSGPFPSSDQFEAQVNRICGPEFGTVDWDGLPSDADGGWFEPNQAGWDLGDHDVACYVYSDTGLVGPVPRLSS